MDEFAIAYNYGLLCLVIGGRGIDATLRKRLTQKKREDELVRSQMKHTIKLGLSAAALILLGVMIAACSSNATQPPGESAPGMAEQVDIEDAPEQGGASTSFFLILVPEETEARFYIDEVLRGEPITVVGATSEVSGQIQVDKEDPTRSQIGPIEVETDSLTTDNSFRNGAIRDLILNSGSFPVVRFTPTSVDGLPEQGLVGETYALTITGELTVRDITRPVIFEATVTPASESRLEGSATTTILRSDFGLTIPTVPNVADVSDQVILEIDFVAVAS